MKVEIIRSNVPAIEHYSILVDGQKVGTLAKIVERDYPYPYKVNVQGALYPSKSRERAMKAAKRMAIEYATRTV